MWENILFNNLKIYKFRFNKKENRSFFLVKGELGLKSLNSNFITQKELKSIFLFVKKNLKKSGQIFFNFMPNHIITKKPIETRMGKGKGNKEQYAAFIPKGRVFITLSALNKKIGLFVLEQIKRKLKLKSVIIFFKI